MTQLTAEQIDLKPCPMCGGDKIKTASEPTQSTEREARDEYVDVLVTDMTVEMSGVNPQFADRRGKLIFDAIATISTLQTQRDRARAERDAMREALEWALNNAGSEHPHYPFINEAGQWSFPYLVNGSPMGGGVGEAHFDSSLDAVTAAMGRDPYFTERNGWEGNEADRAALQGKS